MLSSEKDGPAGLRLPGLYGACCVAALYRCPGRAEPKGSIKGPQCGASKAHVLTWAFASPISPKFLYFFEGGMRLAVVCLRRDMSGFHMPPPIKLVSALCL